MVIADLIESIKLNCGITTHIYNAIRPGAYTTHRDGERARFRAGLRHTAPAQRDRSRCYYLCIAFRDARAPPEPKSAPNALRTQRKYVHFYLRARTVY